jgi:hypothetical protein
MLVSPLLQRLMADAETSTTPVLNAVAFDQSEVQASTTLYYVLLMLCRGPALDRVVNSGVGEGLEAWRQLTLRHEPRQRSRYAGQMMEILGWSFAGDVVARLEAFEREVTQWKAVSQETISDGILIGVVMRNLEDGNLKQHLIMNAERLKTWTDFREELVNVRRAQAAAAGGGVPMDVGLLGKGGKAGKGGGKSKSSECHVCGKQGHYAKDCWHRPLSKGGGKGGKGDQRKGGQSAGGRGQPQGKGDGKKGSDKSKDHVKCHRCGKFGHYANKCPEKSRQAGSVEDPLHGPRESAEASTGGVGGLCLSSLSIDSLDAIGSPCERVTLGIDSGAAVTIVPRGICTDYPLQQNDRSRVHGGYRAANGQMIIDEGSRVLFYKDGKDTRAIRARVGDVSKGLVSVSEMVDCGHRVVFDCDGSYAVHKQTGKKTYFKRRNKVFEIDVDIVPYAMAPDAGTMPGHGGVLHSRPKTPFGVGRAKQ